MAHRILFVTSNEHKVREVKEVIPEIEWLDVEVKEIRSDCFEEISKEKLKEVLRVTGVKDNVVLVEDAGLEIDALKGFPGTYSAWVFKKIGNEGILRLMEGMKNREGRYVAVVSAYLPRENEIRSVRGVVEGKIANEIKGQEGFGYDPIFIPEGFEKTYGEDPKIKELKSHRKIAWEKMKEMLRTLKYL